MTTPFMIPDPQSILIRKDTRNGGTVRSLSFLVPYKKATRVAEETSENTNIGIYWLKSYLILFQKHLHHCPIRGTGFDTLIKFRWGTLVTQRRSGTSGVPRFVEAEW